MKRFFFILLVVAAPACLYSSPLGSYLDRIDLSGYFRLRMWNIIGKTYVPDKLPSLTTYRNINYIDLNFRNRINLTIIPEIEVRTVFDIESFFGKGTASIDSGAASFIPRDVYAVFRPFEGSELLIGLEPFSLPGGYILARDATGLQYSHYFSGSKASVYAAYIRAFDNANDTLGQGSDTPRYQWDNILYIGSRFSIGSIVTGEAYYVYENDMFATSHFNLDAMNVRYNPFTRSFEFDMIDILDDPSGDGRKCSLHWIGLHARAVTGNWFVRLGGIFNVGILRSRTRFYTYRRTLVKAGLLEFEAGYDNRDIVVSVIAEGATGDPDNRNAGISFQDIKGSHDFSLIAVDSTGGLALRGSGESQWYGLYGCGLNIKYALLDTLIIQLKLLHFGTTKTLYWRGHGTTWFGDEIDLSAEFSFRNILSVFCSAGGFLPQRAYNALDSMSNTYRNVFPSYLYSTFLWDIDNHASRSMIFEVMLGVKVTYD
ncbi:MAG: hypothetical protein JXA07_02025 [Spirochaetes bacterium]|nr:hypothetical protein [Spirochaetota bacterium]